jgi:hypothetical protein
MKRGAVLINTSRGPIVDEPALIRAVSSGIIGGAGLDVYDREPLPAGHPLCSADGIVLLPHVGYVSEDNFRVMYGQVVENIAAFGEGTPIRLFPDQPRPRALRRAPRAGTGPRIPAPGPGTPAHRRVVLNAAVRAVFWQVQSAYKPQAVAVKGHWLGASRRHSRAPFQRLIR